MIPSSPPTLARRAAALVALISTALAVGATSPAECADREGSARASGPAFEFAGSRDSAESTFVVRAGDAATPPSRLSGEISVVLEFTPPEANPGQLATFSVRLEKLPSLETDHVVLNLSQQDGLQRVVRLPLPGLESPHQPASEEQYRLTVTRLFIVSGSGPAVVKWDVSASASTYAPFAEPCDATPVPVAIDFAP